MSNFRFIHSQEAVRDISNLIESLPTAPHLEKILVVHKKITFCGVFNLVGHAKLAVEERLTLVPLVHVWTKNIHQIRIAQIDFVRLVKMLQNCRKDQTNGKCLNVKCLAETWARSDSVTKTAVLSFPRASNPLPNPKGQALKAEVQPHSTAHLATQEAHTGRETLPALHPLQAPLLSLSVQAPRLAHSPLQLLDLSSPLLPSHQP